MAFEIKTHHYESLFIIFVLVTPFFFDRNIRTSEVVAALAVYLTFQHAQIADRMQESQANQKNPDVQCHWKSNYYFLGKEALWIVFFVMIHSWAALTGAIVFFLYPFWRKLYRSKVPLKTKTDKVQHA